MIDRFVEWAGNEGWKAEKIDEPITFPEKAVARYGNIPKEWFEFIKHFKDITNPTEDLFFLTCNYFADNSSWFEDISLEAADGDEEWIGEIKSFWDKTFPIIMGVGGGYHYYAIDLETNKIVEGWEPEFEYPTEVADNLNEFLEKILSGEIKLVI